MSSPMLDVPVWPPDWPEISEAVSRCVSNGQWGRYHSEPQDRLKQRLTHTLGVSPEQVRLCSSGTAAIEWSLRAAGVGRGDEVLLAAFDYPGNFRCIELVGATPVLVDVNSHDPCINVDQVAAAAGPRTKAVVASHLFGHAIQIAQLAELCRERKWVLIEDACQVIGMNVNSPSPKTKLAGTKAAGTLGDFGTLSFGGSKVVTAGSGGAIITQSARHAAKLASLIDRPSDTYPMSPLQCAVIEPQLDRLDEMHAIRNANVKFLVRELAGKTPAWTWIPPTDSSNKAAHYKLAVLAQTEEHRQRTITLAGEWGLPIGPGFRSMQRASERRCRKPVELENSKKLGERLMLLDQRLLLCNETQRPILAESLKRLHDQTSD